MFIYFSLLKKLARHARIDLDICHAKTDAVENMLETSACLIKGLLWQLMDE